jgi:hypothetical protein
MLATIMLAVDKLITLIASGMASARLYHRPASQPAHHVQRFVSFVGMSASGDNIYLAG